MFFHHLSSSYDLHVVVWGTPWSHDDCSYSDFHCLSKLRLFFTCGQDHRDKNSVMKFSLSQRMFTWQGNRAVTAFLFQYPMNYEFHIDAWWCVNQIGRPAYCIKGRVEGVPPGTVKHTQTYQLLATSCFLTTSWTSYTTACTRSRSVQSMESLGKLGHQLGFINFGMALQGMLAIHY